MNSYEFNVAQLTAVAKALDDLLPQVIFVGGIKISDMQHFKFIAEQLVKKN
ncbi:MAG: hypothetical protein K6L75_09335 [Cellvibrionaceae bacterium]